MLVTGYNNLKLSDKNWIIISSHITTIPGGWVGVGIIRLKATLSLAELDWTSQLDLSLAKCFALSNFMDKFILENSLRISVSSKVSWRRDSITSPWYFKNLGGKGADRIFFFALTCLKMKYCLKNIWNFEILNRAHLPVIFLCLKMS